jgi:hypothetical protein
MASEKPEAVQTPAPIMIESLSKVSLRFAMQHYRAGDRSDDHDEF